MAPGLQARACNAAVVQGRIQALRPRHPTFLQNICIDPRLPSIQIHLVSSPSAYPLLTSAPVAPMALLQYSLTVGACGIADHHIFSRASGPQL